MGWKAVNNVNIKNTLKLKRPIFNHFFYNAISFIWEQLQQDDSNHPRSPTSMVLPHVIARVALSLNHYRTCVCQLKVKFIFLQYLNDQYIKPYWFLKLIHFVHVSFTTWTKKKTKMSLWVRTMQWITYCRYQSLWWLNDCQGLHDDRIKSQGFATVCALTQHLMLKVARWLSLSYKLA